MILSKITKVDKRIPRDKSDKGLQQVGPTNQQFLQESNFPRGTESIKLAGSLWPICWEAWAWRGQMPPHHRDKYKTKRSLPKLCWLAQGFCSCLIFRTRTEVGTTIHGAAAEGSHLLSHTFCWREASSEQCTHKMLHMVFHMWHCPIHSKLSAKYKNNVPSVIWGNMCNLLNVSFYPGPFPAGPYI